MDVIITTLALGCFWLGSWHNWQHALQAYEEVVVEKPRRGKTNWNGLEVSWVNHQFVNFNFPSMWSGERGRRLLEHHAFNSKPRLRSGRRTKKKQGPAERPNQHVQGLPTHLQRGDWKPTRDQEQEATEAKVSGGRLPGHLRRLGVKCPRRRTHWKEEK